MDPIYKSYMEAQEDIAQKQDMAQKDQEQKKKEVLDKKIADLQARKDRVKYDSEDEAGRIDNAIWKAKDKKARIGAE